MKTIIGLAAVFLLVGCGGGGTTYVTEEPAVPEIPAGTGEALIVTASGGSDVGLSYTKVSDNGILIDCGSAGCGDIYVGSEVGEPDEDGPSIDTCGGKPDCK